MAPMPPIMSNSLFYGNNLDILREHVADASIDLVYLDPPFNSSRNYYPKLIRQQKIGLKRPFRTFPDQFNQVVSNDFRPSA